jgi:hypothetical protein
LQSIICGRDFLEIVGVETLENVESVVAWKCKGMQAHSILPQTINDKVFINFLSCETSTQICQKLILLYE